MSDVPSYDQLMTPLFHALKELGGSGSITEIEDKVLELLALPESVVEIPHNPEKSNQTSSRIDWHGHAHISRNTGSSRTQRVVFGPLLPINGKLTALTQRQSYARFETRIVPSVLSSQMKARILMTMETCPTRLALGESNYIMS